MVTKAIAEREIIWKEGFLDKSLLVVNVSVQENTPSEIVIAQILKELDVCNNPALEKVKDQLKTVIETFSELKLFGSGYTAKDKSNDSKRIYLEAEKYIRRMG